jgi:AhpD family alkylhydroperoxidase
MDHGTPLEPVRQPARGQGHEVFRLDEQGNYQNSTLPKSTQELVMLRACQINGCGWCSDVHTKELAHAGETPVRMGVITRLQGGGYQPGQFA